MSTDMIQERTAIGIAQEINEIKEKVRDVAIRGAIEIGKRLQEAKSMVPYGEWGKWLAENVDYSERTAQDLMRIASEYGRKETQALSEIQNTTQAVMLLALDGIEREKFVQEHDMATISTRELEEEIRKLKEENAKQQLTIDELMGCTPAAAAEEAPLNVVDQGELEAAKEHAKQLMQQLEEAEKNLAEANGRVVEAEKRRAEDAQRERVSAGKAAEELKAAKAATQEAKQKAEAQAKQLKRMEEELEAARAQVRTVEVLPGDVEAELNRLRGQAARSTAESELRAAFDGFKNAFEYLMNKLGAAEEIDPEGVEKYRTAFSKAARTMAQRME